MSFRITYDGNGNTVGTVPIDVNDYTTGQTATVLNNTDHLGNPDYMFVGWNIAVNGSGTTYLPGDSLTIVSGNITLFALWVPATMIISEVGDPVDNGKFVELYNATSVPISLEGWEIRLYPNGGDTISGAILPDIDLGAGATFVVVNIISDFLYVYPEPTYGCYPDIVDGAITGNGDDVYELYDGTKTVDIYGVIGESGGIWNYANCVVQRIPAVIHGTDNFNISEWSFGDSGTNFPASPGSR